MKIIGAGFGRMGTMSLKVALEELGYGPCYHMVELFENPEHLSLWEAAAEGEPIRWEKLLGDYQATVDWPGAAFYKELMKAYPGAKVLLSVRDPEKWYESTKITIASPGLAPQMVGAMGRAPEVLGRIIWQRTFGGNFEDRGYAIEVFERHNQEVREYVPADRLLVYEVKEGWEPLCEFLNVELPKDRPFPHLNDAATFRNRFR